MSRIPTRSRLVLAALLAALLASSPARALTEGVTTQGLGFLSGGVGQDERASMSARRNQFSLHLTAAARGSGAYLGEVQVLILDSSGRQVLQTTMDGPWLMVGLALGEYRIKVRHGNQTLEKSTQIHASDLHEAFFYFDADTETIPSGKSR
ncbi:MAG: hypothetical protein VW339_07605 [Quisquiliibacterium sp.]